MSLLISKINYEPYANLYNPITPDISIEVLQDRFPNHVDFNYKIEYTQPINGIFSGWYNLYGKKEG